MIIITIIIISEYQLLRAMKNAPASLHKECGSIFMDKSGFEAFGLDRHAYFGKNNEDPI